MSREDLLYLRKCCYIYEIGLQCPLCTCTSINEALLLLRGGPLPAPPLLPLRGRLLCRMLYVPAAASPSASAPPPPGPLFVALPLQFRLLPRLFALLGLLGQIGLVVLQPAARCPIGGNQRILRSTTAH